MGDTDSDIDTLTHVYSEQVRLLYRNAPLSLTLTLIGGLTLALAQRPYIPTAPWTGWVLLLLLVTGGRALLAYRYLHASPQPDAAGAWGPAYVAGAGLAGVMWGSAAILLFPENAVHHQVFIAFILAGISAGAIGVLPARMEAVVAFMLPALLPLGTRFFLSEGDLSTAMGAMIIVYLMGMLGVARNIHRSIRSALLLDAEKRVLLARLEKDKALTDRLNEKLVKENSERRQAEQALRDSEQRFRQLAENIPQVFWLASADFTSMYYVSPAYEALWQRSCDSLYERPDAWLDAIHPEDREPVVHGLVASLQRVLGAKTEFQYRIVRPDASVRWIRTLIIPIPNENGQPYRVAGLAEDITARKRADEQTRSLQAELAHLGRLTVAGEMASGLAHELNQPLSAIATYAETCQLLIDAKQPSPEDLHTTASQIAAQSRRAGEIIRRMRDFTRRVEPQRAPADINALIREMVRFCETEATQRETSVRLDLGANLPTVFADAIQIQQVVLNLMRNGIEAMDINDVGSRNLVIRTALAGSHLVEVAVIDSGPGLSAAAKQRLFHPFFTTKSDGMGLGLSISRSIIEAHDGRLWVTANAPRPGATFHFTLPAVNFGPRADY